MMLLKPLGSSTSLKLRLGFDLHYDRTRWVIDEKVNPLLAYLFAFIENIYLNFSRILQPLGRQL